VLPVLSLVRSIIRLLCKQITLHAYMPLHTKLHHDWVVCRKIIKVWNWQRRYYTPRQTKMATVSVFSCFDTTH